MEIMTLEILTREMLTLEILTLEQPSLNISVVSMMMVFSSCVPTSGSIANCIGRDVDCCALGSVPIPGCVASFQWSPQPQGQTHTFYTSRVA